MQRADTTHGQMKTHRSLQRSGTENARGGDLDSKPQRPKKPQKFSAWKPRVMSAENSERTLAEPQPQRFELPDTSSHAPAIERRPVPDFNSTAQKSESSGQHYRTSYAASTSDSTTSEAGQIELLRVRSMILEAGYEFPGLRGRVGESTEDAVFRLLEHHRSLNIALQESHFRLAGTKKADEATVLATEEALRSAKDELRYVKNELHDCEAAVQDHKNNLGKAEALIKTMAAKHGADMKKYTSKIKDLESELDASAERAAKAKQEQSDYTTNLAALAKQKEKTSELERVVKSLQVKNVELISTHVASRKQETDALRNEHNILKAGHENQIHALNADRKQETDALRKDQRALKEHYERQISDIRGEFFKRIKNDDQVHKKTIEGLQAQLNDERAKADNHIAALKKELKLQLADCEQGMRIQLTEQEKAHRQILEKEQTRFKEAIDRYDDLLHRERAQLKEVQKGQEERRAEEQRRLDKELRKQEESLKNLHEQEQYQLRSAVEDLKGALVVKEHFKGLADSEVASHFNKLAREIEDFSRLEWNAEREAEWSEQLQQLHPRNTRKLKQALVQNSVWIGLRALIFRSPFEMFGEEESWKELNKQWIDIYTLKTPPQEWPKVPKDVEKSRYEGAKQLRAAIEPSTNVGSDRLGKLKMKYEELVEVTTSAIAINVEKVAGLKDKDRKSLYKIVRMSSELWLECCSQRYRLVVILAGGVEDVLAQEQIHFKAVKLVFRPELRRFGNAHGDRMEVGEPVTGWKTVVETYPPQRSVSV